MDRQAELNVVTGATGYTGKYIARRLLKMGKRVRSLTGHLHRENPFGTQIELFPYSFDNPRALAESLRGATTLYNTYWVRFSHGRTTFDSAIQNTKILLEAAQTAGLQRIVHISIANPDKHSSLPYYKGKALLEEAVIKSGLRYVIIRPTVIFGPEDILINNIAWLLKTFPIFAIAGSGEYRIQPIFVEDVVELAVSAAARDENVAMDAVGPETFTFNELVRLVAKETHSKAQVVHVAPRLALLFGRLIGYALKDVVLTQEEVEGLLANLLVSSQPPTGKTYFTEWLKRNAVTLGSHYSSELNRHYKEKQGGSQCRLSL